MKHVLLLAIFVLSYATTTAQAGILKIQEVKSPGGITAWLVEDHTIPVTAFSFAFKGSGTANDPADKQGLARILSNTLDEGAGPLDSTAFQKTLGDLSISLGFAASRDLFSGSIKTLSANKDKAFELMTLALTEPRFEPDAVNRMVLSNLSRIKSDMTDPKWMAARLLNDTVFKDHPYGMNSGGTLTSLTKITPADLKHKIATEFSRDRLIVSVAGDITAEELAIRLDQLFGKLPATATTPAIADVKLPAAATVLYKKDIPQTVIQMTLPGIPVKDPDYFAAEIMNFVFGGAGFGSRLMEVIREQRGLTYGIYSGLNNNDHSTILSISSSSKNSSAKELIDLTRAEMEKFTKAPITADELHNAKTYLIGSVPLDLTSTEAIAGYMMAFQAEGLPKDYLDRREAGLKAVTAADVTRVAGRTLVPEQMTVILVGNPDTIQPTQTVTTLPNVE